MNFQPYPTYSGFVSLGIALVAAVVAIFLVNLLPQQNDLTGVFRLLIGLLIALSIMAAAFYWTGAAFKLHYHLNRNGVAIQWGFSQQRIPFEIIEKITFGENLSIPAKFKGLNVAGLRFGWGELDEYGPTKFYTTATLGRSLLVVTPNQSYAISPKQPEKFLQAWQMRQALEPTQHWSVGIHRNWPLNISFLADPLTWWLWGLATLVCLALFGYIGTIFPELPREFPIQFDAFEQARLADKSTLFALPAVGLAILILNALLGSLIYPSERVAAYFLWGSAMILQLCLWIAVLMIIP